MECANTQNPFGKHANFLCDVVFWKLIPIHIYCVRLFNCDCNCVFINAVNLEHVKCKGHKIRIGYEMF